MPWSVHTAGALSLVTAACLLAWAGFRIWRRLQPSRPQNHFLRLVILFFAALMILLVPLRGAPLLYALRAAISDFSITTFILATAACLGDALRHDVIPAAQRRILLRTVAAIAVLFYPLSLGLGPVDPYAWGYFSTPMLAAFGLASLAFLLHRDYWIVLILGAALLSATAGLLQSTNLWDYLIDPVLSLYAVAVVSAKAAWSGLTRLRLVFPISRRSS